MQLQAVLCYVMLCYVTDIVMTWYL